MLHDTSTAADAIPLFCARCAMTLEPGGPTFYRVNIEAVADPTPPVVAAEDLESDHLREEIQDLLAKLAGVSAQEAMDQVHRRLTLFFCGPCFRQWIENPAG